MSQVADGPHVLSTLSDQFADAVEWSRPRVVQVNGRPRRPSSGVVYAPTLVLAAEHAIERDEDLSVEAANGPALAAQLVGRDLASDLAVLQVLAWTRSRLREPRRRRVWGSSSWPWAGRPAASSWPASAS